MPYNNVITDDDEDRHLSVNRTRLDDHSSLPEMGACLLTEVLTNLYNSTIRMWPCPSQCQVSSKLYHKFDFSTFLLFSSRTDWNKITLNQIKFKFNWVALIDSWPSLTSTSIFIELGGIYCPSSRMRWTTAFQCLAKLIRRQQSTKKQFHFRSTILRPEIILLKMIANDHCLFIAIRNQKSKTKVEIL